ncbi:MAG: hypothetical protein A2138_01490 [Deltaproteobacteria bacterium RBG_16_71_12]|nr:MAG: hypothetical protein A2138_01490 [Deltaproteobacteria bacterium RBG_16_71_12]
MRTTSELTWSAFLREPTSVEPLLAKGDVLLKRRDAEPLRLTRATGDDATRQALATAARLLAPAAGEEVRERLDRDVAARLPWTRFLPDEDRKLFVKEFIREFEACADLGDFTALGRLLVGWKNTATLHAEGLAEILKRPIGKVGKRVPRPK